MRVEEAVREIPPLAKIGYDRFRRHCPAAFVRRRQPPEAFFSSEEIAQSFGFVLTGRVKLRKRHVSGADATLDIVVPGNLLCMSRPYACVEYCCDAVADAPNTRVLIVNRDHFLGLMAESNDAARYFIHQLGGRSELLCQRVEELSSGRVEQRLGTILLRLAQQIGEVIDGGMFIPLSLSRRDLADLSATTPETATRIMRRLEKASILATRQNGILIMSLVGLEAVARGDG